MKKLLTIIISLTIAGLAATLFILSYASNYDKIYLTVTNADELNFIPSLVLDEKDPELNTKMKVNMDDFDTVVVNYPNFYNVNFVGNFYLTDNAELNTVSMDFYGDYTVEDGVLTINIDEVPIKGYYNIYIGVDSKNTNKIYDNIDNFNDIVELARKYNNGEATSSNIGNIFEGGFYVE